MFKRCGKTIDVVDSAWNGDIVTVPSEMTEEAGLLVHVGVYGVSEDGKRITPTLYAPLGAVALGAEPDGDPSTDPTLPVWAQIQAQIGDLADLTTTAKDTLVAAINEAAWTGGGTGGCYLTVETITIGEGTGETVAVTGITLDYSTISLNEGESMDKIAKRIMNVQEMNKTQSIRSARTIVTGAENKGRQDSYAEAEAENGG